MAVKIIGDPHGKLEQYKLIVTKAALFHEKTLSLGDNGFLDKWTEGEEFIGGLDGGFENHKWLGGNHDIYPNNQFKQSLNDFGIWENLFYIRGAKSIDRAKRIEGRDWFQEEELSYSQMMECFYLYESIKPDFVVSHDCPQTVREKCFNIFEKSPTTTFLQELFEIHQPKIWVFGHYHQNVTTYLKNTTFICLNELQTITLI